MDEERDELELSVLDGQAVNTTINTKGWQKIIRPAMDDRLKSLAQDFCNATTYEEFVSIQQSINAINFLMNFIEIKLIDGKNALRELKP